MDSLNAVPSLNDAAIKDLKKAFHAGQTLIAAEDQAWWDSLDDETRATALRQVAKLMHKAEVEDRGSYRWAMYDIFNVSYGDGLNHYMTLHNLIARALDGENRERLMGS